MGLGLAAGFVAEALVRLIGLVTNLAFYHRLSWAFAARGPPPGLVMVSCPWPGGSSWG